MLKQQLKEPPLTPGPTVEAHVETTLDTALSSVQFCPRPRIVSNRVEGQGQDDFGHSGGHLDIAGRVNAELAGIQSLGVITAPVIKKPKYY
jgi:hypothetical protein